MSDWSQWPALGMMYATRATLLFVEVMIAACLFAHGQPTRPHPWRRAAAITAVVFAAGMLAPVFITLLQVPDVSNYHPGALEYGLGYALVPMLVACSLFLLVTIPSLLACFEISPWAAIFCATAGYSLQNLASGLGETVGLVLIAAGVPGIVPGENAWLTAISCATTYAVAYLLCQRNPAMLAMIVVVMFGIIGFDLILKYVVTVSLPLSIVLCLRLFHVLICVFVIIAEVELVVVRQLSSEKAAAERLLAEQERQYQLSRENIEAINIKCHDLRHQIRSLATGDGTVDKDVLESVAREVNVYDSKVRTGNDALDTILTEKSLLCEGRGITLTCVADGESLGFMAPADLYALFGNALDNAIEAVEHLDDAARRSISLIVRRRAGTVTIHVENYYDPTASAKSFKGDVPASTKGNPLNHGFGTRSMKAIVERYGGTLAFSANGTTFCVDAVIPERA